MSVRRADSGTSTSFKPSGVVTGIGSLPIADPTTAIEFVGTWCPRLPFCPQPPGSDLVGVTLTQLDPKSEAATRFDLFTEAVLGQGFPDAVAFKTQVVGPFTLAHLLGVAGAVRAVDTLLLARLADHVARIATRQVRRLLPRGLPVLVYLDEPALVLVDRVKSSASTASIIHVLGAIEAVGGIGGVHCCSVGSPGPLSRLGAAVVSFDATAETTGSAADGQMLSDPEQLVSFGLVPTTGPLPSTGTVFSRWLVDAAATGEPCELARRTIVTASCGLGAVNLAFAQASFKAATHLGGLIGQMADSGFPFSAA